jgi:hypothetical protein
MLIDEMFHDEDEYGHYVDTDMGWATNDFYKNNNIEIVIQKQSVNPEQSLSFPMHIFYLCIIGYLSYSLLFKKL